MSDLAAQLSPAATTARIWPSLYADAANTEKSRQCCNGATIPSEDLPRKRLLPTCPPSCPSRTGIREWILFSVFCATTSRFSERASQIPWFADVFRFLARAHLGTQGDQKAPKRAV